MSHNQQLALRLNYLDLQNTQPHPINFVADSGTAIAAANTINVLGGTNVTTSALGSTITIDASGGSVPEGALGTVFQGQGIGTPSAYSTATYPSTATSTGTLLRADGTNWTITTSTYPATNAVSTLLYASASNTLSKLSILATPGRQLITDGSIPRWINPQTDVYLSDDLIAGQNNQFGNTNYSANTQNAAGITRTSILNHPGVMQLSTGVNTNGAVGMTHGNTIIATSGRILLNFLAKITTLSDGTDTYTLRIGLGDDGTATGDFANGAYFEYTHGTNSGNWQIKTANNSTRTTNNTSTAADTNWNLYTIDMNAANSLRPSEVRLTSPALSKSFS